MHGWYSDNLLSGLLHPVVVLYCGPGLEEMIRLYRDPNRTRRSVHQGHGTHPNVCTRGMVYTLAEGALVVRQGQG